MPKQFLKLSNFNLGLIETTDSKDIPDNALSKAENINLDKVTGVIENPIVTNDQGDVGGVSGSLSSGFGLFQFEADHREGASASDAGEVYFALCDVDNADIDIWDKTNDNWNTTISAGSTGGMKAVYHFVDEGLRISDANFGGNNSNRIYQYIKRTHFSGLTPGGSADSYDNWFSNDQKLSKPTSGLVGSDNFKYEDMEGHTNNGYGGTSTTFIITTGSLPATFTTELDTGNYIAITSGDAEGMASWTSTTQFELDTAQGWGDTLPTDVKLAIYPDAGEGFVLDVATPTGGSWSSGTYQLGTTFIYDGNQESLIYEMTGTVTVAANDKLTVRVQATSPFGERITGGRVYIRDSTEKGDWLFICDISLKDGVRSGSSGSYTPWTIEQSNTVQVYADFTVNSEPLETYEILNGFSHEESSIDIGQDGEGYKTSVISNRRCFVANVKTRNEDGELIQMRDRIMYSPVGKFDTFPRSFFIDVVRGDAEEWVKLESFNDRLLAFKERTLYIINISSPSPSGWFLEDRYGFSGVQSPASVTKIGRNGVVFVNETGCFLYDGSSLKNMIDGNIKLSTWSSFLGSTPLVGFSDIYSRLYVVNNASGTDAYEYSFISNSWIKLSSFLTALQKTNFITDYNGDAVTAEDITGTIRCLKPTNVARQSGTFTVEVDFKDIDFGVPGQLKKIYAIYLTYKSTGSVTTPIGYYKDGEAVAVDFTGDFSNTISEFDVLKAYPSTTFTCKSLKPRLKIVNTTEFFQIKDLTIEYRPIYKRIA